MMKMLPGCGLVILTQRSQSKSLYFIKILYYFSPVALRTAKTLWSLAFLSAIGLIVEIRKSKQQNVHKF